MEWVRNRYMWWRGQTAEWTISGSIKCTDVIKRGLRWGHVDKQSLELPSFFCFFFNHLIPLLITWISTHHSLCAAPLKRREKCPDKPLKQRRAVFYCHIHHNAMISALVLTDVNNLHLGFAMNNENWLLRLLSKTVTARIKRQMQPHGEEWWWGRKPVACFSFLFPIILPFPVPRSSCFALSFCISFKSRNWFIFYNYFSYFFLNSLLENLRYTFTHHKSNYSLSQLSVLLVYFTLGSTLCLVY